jgi:type IV pilus assembly protein PilV
MDAVCDISNRACPTQAGFSMLEALVTMVILSFGVLGLAGLEARIQVASTESLQRSQAVLLVQDMANRISANRANGATYVTATPLGTGDSEPGSCTGLAGVALDQCEWSLELKGAAEKQAGTGNYIGAMTGARGCVDQISANPPVFRVSVAWQGMAKLSTPSLACGQNLYGSDAFRRAIAGEVAVACLTCP